MENLKLKIENTLQHGQIVLTDQNYNGVIFIPNGYKNAEKLSKLMASAPEMLHQLICAEEMIRKQGLTLTADAILETIRKATK